MTQALLKDHTLITLKRMLNESNGADFNHEKPKMGLLRVTLKEEKIEKKLSVFKAEYSSESSDIEKKGRRKQESKSKNSKRDKKELKS